ncbi:MAG TPA: hypothetical protein PKN04_06770 [bacterium]|nr:hypothetical protein [bacterium]HNT65464.1 hypothetical protein [bacterium]
MKGNKMTKSFCFNWKVLFLVAASFLLQSCGGTGTIPPEIIGQWNSGQHRITVRTKPDNEPFQFTSDSAIVKITVNENKTVFGSIGMAEFQKGKIRKNPRLPWDTGVGYIIECGSIGKIFINDPLDTKEVEIWFGSKIINNTVKASIRYTEGWAKFPMSKVILIKETSEE